MRRAMTILIVGSVLILSGLLILIPSIFFIYNGLSSISVDTIVRDFLRGIVGREDIPSDSGGGTSQVSIILSMIGIVISPILLVDGIIAVIAGLVLMILDRGKRQQTAKLPGA